MYRVLLLNDDYTPMEFVISILQAFFNKDAEEATQIMLQVHNNGVGECGVYTYEIAETKVSQVMDHARKNRAPSFNASWKSATKRPNMYRVLLLNDDYTPMEFVIAILQSFFNKNPEEATEIMLHVHHNGVGECGVFTYEIAETKVAQVMDHARKNQHPLQCIMEKK